jgi:excisionase family DNA binding protein
MAPVMARGPVEATAEERTMITHIDQLLERCAALTPPAPPAEATPAATAAGYRLVGPQGQSVDLPLVIVRLFHEIVHQLVQDRAVSIVPLHKQLTTQQAADLLRVSRPHLITLLERGAIPYTRLGTHRRLAFGDVMAYKRRREVAEAAALDALAGQGEELGLY